MLYDIPPRLKNLPLHLLLGMLLLLGGTQTAMAQNRWYDVEVIIFKQTSKQYLNSEHWPSDVALTELHRARSLQASGGGTRVPFSSLSSSSFRLNSQAARIKSAPDLVLLKHFGWRQAGLDKNRAVPIRVPGMGDSLDGTLKLVLSRYLHIDADLIYRDSSNKVYHLKQSRRMRSKELHYLDSPALGMVIRVTPVR